MCCLLPIDHLTRAAGQPGPGVGSDADAGGVGMPTATASSPVKGRAAMKLARRGRGLVASSVLLWYR